MEEPTELKQPHLAWTGLAEAGEALPCCHAQSLWAQVSVGPGMPLTERGHKCQGLGHSLSRGLAAECTLATEGGHCPTGTGSGEVGAMSRLSPRGLLWAEQDSNGPLTPTSFPVFHRGKELPWKCPLGCGVSVYTKQPAERSGIMVTKVSFQWRKIANTGSQWQGKSFFSRNFCPGDAMTKPQS